MTVLHIEQDGKFTVSQFQTWLTRCRWCFILLYRTMIRQMRTKKQQNTSRATKTRDFIIYAVILFVLINFSSPSLQEMHDWAQQSSTPRLSPLHIHPCPPHSRAKQLSWKAAPTRFHRVAVQASYGHITLIIPITTTTHATERKCDSATSGEL